MNKILDKMITLFEKHREELGCDDPEDLESQEQFENSFADLICEYQGHNLEPDQCRRPEHDYCVMCNKRREKLFPNGE